MEIYHTPRKVKLMMLEHRVDEGELAQLIKYGIIEPPVELRIIYRYGKTEDYTLSTFTTACNWMKQVEEKRVGVVDYYLERFVVKNDRIKLAKYYIEDIVELEKQSPLIGLF